MPGASELRTLPLALETFGRHGTAAVRYLRKLARKHAAKLDGDSAEDVVPLGGFEIEAALTQHKATASLKPIYDPDGERLRM